MSILNFHHKIRSAFLGGFDGQLVSRPNLAVLLVVAGTGLALYGPPIFSLSNWLTGLVLIGFAYAGRYVFLMEEKGHHLDSRWQLELLIHRTSFTILRKRTFY